MVTLVRNGWRANYGNKGDLRRYRSRIPLRPEAPPAPSQQTFHGSVCFGDLFPDVQTDPLGSCFGSLLPWLLCWLLPLLLPKVTCHLASYTPCSLQRTLRIGPWEEVPYKPWRLRFSLRTLSSRRTVPLASPTARSAPRPALRAARE